MKGPFAITRDGRFLLSEPDRLGPSLEIATGSWDVRDKIFGDDLAFAVPISDEEAARILASAPPPPEK
jgi:hypothetical protein